MIDDLEERFAAWIGDTVPGARDVTVEGLDRAEMGHSAETLLLTLGWTDDEGGHRREVAVRIRPPAPGLLEPYDLARQFAVLRGLESTPVRAPRAYWLEPSGSVLGREFYVMERLPGSVYEREVPAELVADPDRIRQMCQGIVEQLAAIHTVDLADSGLDALGDGDGYLDRQLEHWSGEIRRVRRGPLPALERLAQAVGERRPAQGPVPTLVHGDPKPGNFAFRGSEVSAVFDWEMATVGDPLADIGWAEVVWAMPGSFTTLPGALSTDELVAAWEGLTGISAGHRAWYRAFQGLKMAVILLVGGHLFDSGATDDVRLMQMAYGIRSLTQTALLELGIEEELPTGPVLARKERMQEVTGVTGR